MKPCTSCKFYQGSVFFGLPEPTCLHPKCIDKGFTHTDPVSGKTNVWQDRPMACYKARFPSNPCGTEGNLWETRR